MDLLEKKPLKECEQIPSSFRLAQEKKIHTLGDEASLAVSGLDGFTVIRFRKNNIYVELVAPSKELAMDLAETLAEVIT